MAAKPTVYDMQTHEHMMHVTTNWRYRVVYVASVCRLMHAIALPQCSVTLVVGQVAVKGFKAL